MQEYKAGDIVTIKEELILFSDETPERKHADASVLKHVFNQPLKVEQWCTCPVKHYKVTFCENGINRVLRSGHDVWIPSAYLEPYENMPMSANKEDLCNILQE